MKLPLRDGNHPEDEAYADSPVFEVLLFANSFDGGVTRVIDLAQGEELPEILSF